MNSVTPSLSTILEVFDTFGPPGTPMTTAEVAAEFDCTTRTIYNRLDTLVDQGKIKTKKVGAHERVWWLSSSITATKRDDSLHTNIIPLAAPEHQLENDSEQRTPKQESTSARFTALFENSPDMIDVLDAHGRLIDVNRRLCTELGYSETELIGEGIWEYDQAIDQDGVGALLADLSVDEPQTFEARYRRSDGSVFPVEVNLVRLDIEGKDRFMAISRDISERKRQRELLERREQVLRQMYDITVNNDQAFSDQVADLLALGRSELGTVYGSLSKIDGEAYTFEVVDTDDDGIEAGDVVPVSATNCERVASDEQTLVLGDVARDAPEQTDRQGYTEWGISCYIGAPVYVDGEVYGTFCFYGDEPREGQFSEWEITLVDLMSQWVSYELDRTEREHKYRRLTEQISDAYYAVDTEFNVTYWNDMIAEQTGISADAIIGENLFGQLPELQETVVEARFTEALASQEQVSCEQYYEPLDYWMSLQIYPDADGLAVITTDITDRKERETQLEQYETIVETVDDGIYAVDSESRFIMVNEGFCELTGYERDELIGEHIRTIHSSKPARQADVSSSPTGTSGRTIGSIKLVGSSVSTSQNDTISVSPKGSSTETASRTQTTTSIELDVETSSGEIVPCESRLASFPLSEDDGRCGVIRDVSNRLEREQELHNRVHQQEVVTKLSKHALENGDLDSLMFEAADLVAEALDNKYCKVLDLDAEAEELLLRQGVGWDEGIAGSATVSSVEDESQAAFTLASKQPIRVEDLDTETRFSGPALLTSHEVRSGISTIIGPYEDPWGILGTHDPAPTEISEYDVNFVESVANILSTAINRHEREQILHSQREQLAQLNSINEVVQEITDAVINQSTREEIEEIVCTCLAEADSYEFAWIGEIDTHSQTVIPRTEAGVTDYLEEMTISVRTDDPKGQGPGETAVRTKEMQVIHDPFINPEFEPWHDNAEQYDYRSAALIPIIYDRTLYGLLGVYANRSDAFDDEVREVIAGLGEIVGHAIAATERKQALMSPEITEIQYVIPNILETMNIRSDSKGTIQFNRAVPIGDDSFLEYGTVDEEAIETLQAIVDHHPHAEELTITTSGEGIASQFEMRVAEPPIISTVASCGGQLQQTKIENGNLHMTIHLPTSAAAKQVIDLIYETYPTANLLKRRQIKRSEDKLSEVYQMYTEDLTERQRSALETAVYSGFFEWPRNASGGDIADSLGVSSPTFHQHLRLAQKKVFESLLLSPSPE